VNPGDFSITEDSCLSRRVSLGQDCAIGVTFKPSATGERHAHISLTDNEPTPSQITLSGTGVASSAGPAGAAGSTGSKGATGATGPAGPSGEVELVSCKAVRLHGKTVQSCTAHLTTAALTIASAGARFATTLSRGGVVYGSGETIVLGRTTQVLLTPRRAITKGTYTLTLTRGRVSRHETIRIA
jgi:hypothetical protein